MKMLTRLIGKLSLLAALLLVLTASALAAPKMNFVVILADDLGWKDLSSYGSDFYETPHLDKLASDGVRFTQAYAACTVCSPTRAALMTGKYPARVRITDWIPGQPPENPKLIVPNFTKYLPYEETSLAEAMKAGGYATASIGKWHLGGEEYYPEKHGFDINIGGTHAPGVTSYFSPYKNATLPDGPEGEYVTDRLSAETMRWLDANKDKPFFLYLPHFAVHTPIQAKKDIIQKYRAKKRDGLVQTNEIYAAMLESLDLAVGKVRQKLDELNLSDRTVIVFTSDNGGRLTQGTTSNQPLRAGKGGCYEGGTRVPMIVYWPGVTKKGTVSETPVITMDLYPTLLEIAGLKKEAKKGVDGLSLVSLLRSGKKLKRDELFWHYPHYQHYQLGGTTPYGAIRQGDFKLIEFYDDKGVELYNLKDDLSEKRNLAADEPKKVAQLRKRLQAWRKEVAAQMPTPNPNYDPTKPEHNPANRKKAAGK